MSITRVMKSALAQCAAVVTLSGGCVHALHLDIVPYFEPDGPGNYKFSVGRFDFTKKAQGEDGTTPPAPIERNVHVFFGAFGVRPHDGAIVNGDPGWTLPEDAAHFDGFGAEYPDGTLPPELGSLKFNVVADPRLGRNLSYWNGVGTPSFGPVPSGEILDVIEPTFISPGSVTLDGGNTSLPGFEIEANLHPGFHAHTGHRLWGDAARSGDAPTPGFYLYSLNLEIEGGAIFPNYPEFTGAIWGVDAVSPTFHVILAHGFEAAGDKYVYGDPLFEEVWEQLFDDQGNPLLDEFGNPTYGQVLDDQGNPVLIPVLDDEGNPVLEIIGTDGYVLGPEMARAVDWVHANLAAVPEPGSLVMLVGGVSIVGLYLRRRS